MRAQTHHVVKEEKQVLGITKQVGSGYLKRLRNTDIEIKISGTSDLQEKGRGKRKGRWGWGDRGIQGRKQRTYFNNCVKLSHGQRKTN